MKGQYLTLEYVIFFLIGILMMLSVYYAFTDMNGMYSEGMLESQLKLTGEMISGAIVNVYEASQATNSTINYTLPIPDKLSSCIYSVDVNGGNLELECTNVPDSEPIELTLYNLNIVATNIIYSTNGAIRLHAGSGTVELS
jgi:hypothetical protein